MIRMEPPISSNRGNQHFTNRWQPSDGWMGIIPGVSKLDDLIARLGYSHVCRRTGNYLAFEFAERTIEAIVLQGEQTVRKLRIKAEYVHDPSLPRTLEAALNFFGPLTRTHVNESGEAFFEGNGIRMACDSLGPDQRLKWIEMYQT